jgi:HK97 family phage major capsid protein
MNAKAVSVASSAGGGYAVPEEIGKDIAQFQLRVSPVRSLVRVSRAGTSDIKRLLDLTGAEGGWRSESGSVTETDTPQLREIVPTGGELWAYPKTSNFGLEDLMFDVRGWLVESVGRKFAQMEGAAVVSGTGHWEITSDASGVKYVASGDPAGSFYVKVTSGQYLRLSGVIIEEASSEAADPLASADLKDGTYRVGYDIEEGWYTGTVTGESTIGYWQISTDANGQKLAASNYPRGAFTFKVTDGQYLTLRGVTASLQE